MSQMEHSAPSKPQRRSVIQWLGFGVFMVLIAAANLAVIYNLANKEQKVLTWQSLKLLRSSSSNSSSGGGGSGDDSIELLQLAEGMTVDPPEAVAAAVTATAAAAAAAQVPRIFVGVLSSAANAKSREVIRQTWGSDPLITRVMFFCLRPSSDDTFRQLRQEAATQRDIFITSEILEHYYNITYAVFDIFKVAAAMSDSFDYVIKTDDDVYVRPRLLLDALSTMPRKKLYAGWPMESGSVLRTGNYHVVSYDNWKSNKPVRYAYGGGYVLSMDLARAVAAGAPHMIMPANNLLIIEDVAMGYWVEYIAQEQKSQVTYSNNITLGLKDCASDTMFYHITKKPKWPEMLCMHKAGGCCCTPELCSACVLEQIQGASTTPLATALPAPRHGAATAASDKEQSLVAHQQTAPDAEPSTPAHMVAAPAAVRTSAPTGQPSATGSLLQALDGPTTDAPMMPQPPFAPGCFPPVDKMRQLGCPVMDCSQDVSCTIHNTSCCAYFNYQLLDFLDSFLTANCLDGHYMLAYGTVLGAVRSQPILPHTEDVDIALTPLAIQFLELNSTKELLWRYGYTFWHHYERRVWKLCSHIYHPSPHFQAVMVRDMGLIQYEKTTGRLTSAYVDAWLMWPVEASKTRCSRSKWGQRLDVASQLSTPWDGNSTAWAAGVDVCQLRQQNNKTALPINSTVSSTAAGSSAGSTQKFCVNESEVPLTMVLGSRTAKIGDRAFPMPEMYARVMSATYGLGWRKPNTKYHRTSVHPKEESALRHALLEKLSTTAWGGMTWQERKASCDLG